MAPVSIRGLCPELQEIDLAVEFCMPILQSSAGGKDQLGAVRIANADGRDR